ncbi:MAG TPA: GPW/gp25 family protein [Allosphingosinicella sp.]|nr:GPW/gp25 family protein [Allosphingosinicella sp.]
MNIAFPLRFDSHGRTAECDVSRHVRNMIEQLLFTLPGERVNRPEFGCGLMHAVFAANGPEIAAALEFNARAALERHLGDVIDVRRLSATADEAVLLVEIAYVIRSNGETRYDEFTLGAAS